MKDTMLILHFIGLVMGVGTGFAHAFLGAPASKMNTDEATKFRLHTLVLGTMGNIGIILLLISGLFLITPYWSMLSSFPLLIAKLALVVILLVLLTMINLRVRKAVKGDAERQIAKIQQLGKLTLPISLIIVILAVMTFH